MHLIKSLKLIFRAINQSESWSFEFFEEMSSVYVTILFKRKQIKILCLKAIIQNQNVYYLFVSDSNQ